MENLWNNKREGMSERENKMGKNWDLVTCHYGVRLANHAPYRDWVRLPLFYCHSLLPQSTSLVAFHFYLDFRVVRISCADLPFPLKKRSHTSPTPTHSIQDRERERVLPEVFSDIQHEIQSLSKDSTV